MNKMTFASIAAFATALMGTPAPVLAGHHHHDNDDEVIAAIGGFIGGVIVGSAINNGAPPPPPPARVEVSYGHSPSHRHGHWEWRTVRVWVPGYWAWADRDCGRPRKVWVDGYYDRRRERVWIAHRGPHGCDRGCR